MISATPEPAAHSQAAQALGHPRGLYTLFFTEMWERFSYYGMRALLVLFLVEEFQRTGLSKESATAVATAIYGLYTALVYLAALPGGWVADRLLGAQRSVWFGGILIAAGHFSLAVPTRQTFFLGLLLIIVGTGLLKPNISAIVGDLYPEGGARRDAGFTIFYMGINLGAAVGPLVCAFLGEPPSAQGGGRAWANWHYGFAAAGVGMVLGLIQFRITAKHLGDAGLRPRRTIDPADRRLDKGWYIVAAALAALVLFVVLGLTGAIRIDPIPLADRAKYVIAAVSVAYFLGILLLGQLDSREKKRMLILAVLLIGCAVFWSGFEQAGSSLNLFAKDFTRRLFLGFEIPAGWLQSVNAVFIIIFAPVAASLWVALARRRLNPPVIVKFALGLILLGVGFLVMVGATQTVIASQKSVLPTWLILTYLIHTFGELCLSPVGLSAMTKLSPRRYVGQMMGLWFAATSLGNLIAGRLAGKIENIVDARGMFLQVVLLSVGAGLVILLVAWPARKLTDDEKESSAGAA